MGAPKGNKNALKNGLYAKHFTPEERAGLQKMKPQDSTHEMYVLQVVISDLFEQHILEREHVKKLRAQGRRRAGARRQPDHQRNVRGPGPDGMAHFVANGVDHAEGPAGGVG